MTDPGNSAAQGQYLIVVGEHQDNHDNADPAQSAEFDVAMLNSDGTKVSSFGNQAGSSDQGSEIFSINQVRRYAAAALVQSAQPSHVTSNGTISSTILVAGTAQSAG